MAALCYSLSPLSLAIPYQINTTLFQLGSFFCFASSLLVASLPFLLPSSPFPRSALLICSLSRQCFSQLCLISSSIFHSKQIRVISAQVFALAARVIACCFYSLSVHFVSIPYHLLAHQWLTFPFLFKSPFITSIPILFLSFISVTGFSCSTRFIPIFAIAYRLLAVPSPSLSLHFQSPLCSTLCFSDANPVNAVPPRFA